MTRVPESAPTLNGEAPPPPVRVEPTPVAAPLPRLPARRQGAGQEEPAAAALAGGWGPSAGAWGLCEAGVRPRGAPGLVARGRLIMLPPGRVPAGRRRRGWTVGTALPACWPPRAAVSPFPPPGSFPPPRSA